MPAADSPDTVKTSAYSYMAEYGEHSDSEADLAATRPSASTNGMAFAGIYDSPLVFVHIR